MLDQPAAEAQQDVAGTQKEARFDQAVVDQADHRTVGAQAADAGAEGDDAHVFDAGIGQHALVLGLFENEGRRGRDRDQAEDHQDRPRKATQAGGVHDFVGFEDPQVGAVQQHPGEQGRGRAGGLAVGIRQPGVHRRQTHFGAVSHCSSEPMDFSGRVESSR